ncbi:MAG: hypothetical protein EBE86_021845 [Hormoscilla sp. GUM202]|nr:hypothetical protein [Hormoscilla sp. GUM202]
MKQEVKKNKWQKLTFYTSLLLCATTFLLATGGLFLYSREQQQILTEARRSAKQKTVRAALEIDREVRLAKDTALAIANDLTAGRLNDAEGIKPTQSRTGKKGSSVLGLLFRTPKIAESFAM